MNDLARRPSPHRALALLCGAALALAACGPTPRPVPQGSPTVAATASPARTVVVSVRRPSPGLPTRATATPDLPRLTPAAGAALVDQAIALMLARSVAPLPSGDLYGAAYDGAVVALRRAGFVVEAESPAFTNRPADDAARFLAAYARLGAAATETNGTTLAYAAIRAATDRLDECNTALPDVPAERQARAPAQATPTATVGIGALLRAQGRPAAIDGVYADSPAERAGLRRDDTIVAIDGRDVAALPAEAVAGLLRGAAGTTVRVLIRRPGEPAARPVAVTRGEIPDAAVVASVVVGPDGRAVGYLRLRTLAAGSDAALRQGVERLRAAAVTGWVLDLREATGDTPEALAALAGLLLNDGQPFAYRSGAGGTPVALGGEPRASLGPLEPLAVLTNGGTAGTPEVLAAALRERGAARLFGEATAGCVSIPETFALSGGASLRLGTRLLLTPAQRSLAGRGQAPDETILELVPGGDAALGGALRWLAR